MMIFTIFLATFFGLFNTIFVAAAPTYVNALSSPQAASIHGRLYNNCGFTVYVRQNVAERPGVNRPGFICPGYTGSDTEVQAIGSRGEFVTPLPTYQDTCGHSIKVSRDPNGPVYQYEFNWALENNKITYNLSHNDGNPFTDMVRQIGGPPGSSCPYLRYEPGDQGTCDDPKQADCDTVGDIIGFLC